MYDMIANSTLPGGIVHLVATRPEAVTGSNKDGSILLCRVKLIQCAESVLLREVVNKLEGETRVDAESMATGKTANDTRDSANDSNCLRGQISVGSPYS